MRVLKVAESADILPWPTPQDEDFHTNWKGKKMYSDHQLKSESDILRQKFKVPVPFTNGD